MRTENGCAHSTMQPANQEIADLIVRREQYTQELKTPGLNATRAYYLRTQIESLNQAIATARQSFQALQKINQQTTPPPVPRLWAPGSGNTQGAAVSQQDMDILNRVRFSAMNAGMPESKIKELESLPWQEILGEMDKQPSLGEKAAYLNSYLIRRLGLSDQMAYKFIRDFLITPEAIDPGTSRSTRGWN